ncbi:MULTISPECIES: ATP-binding protein [unclassified Flavobacterium]|uniref:tetratricopeptide repeat-containing sensor histidine kinase n=1 Tax=unclassified Flavobacterium TaxID=196869 RepID=UPI001F143688|nr:MULTISPECIES: ATP-binding protein [unclassified Flavobacterium]UMY66934.1 histidine kinase [Flavobacterium sp. HJ-32-4]
MNKRMLLSLLLLFPLLASGQVLDSILRQYRDLHNVDPERTRRIIEEGIEGFSAKGDRESKAILLVKLIALETAQRNTDAAYRRFLTAREYARNNGITLQVACAYSEIAETYYYAQDWKRSLGYFHSADSAFVAAKDEIGQVLSKINMASIYQEQGKYDLAIRNFLASVPHIDTTQYRYIKTSAYKEVGKLYLNLKDGRKAEYYLTKSIQSGRRDKGHPDLLLDAYLLLSGSFLERGDKEKAAMYLDRAEKMAARPETRHMLFDVLTRKVELLMKQERYPEAKKNINEALRLADEYKKNTGETFGLRSNLAKIYRLENKSDSAIALSQQLVAETAKSSEMARLAEGYLGMAAAYAQKGDYRQAYENHLQYAAYKDSTVGSEKQRIIREAEVKYETAEKERQLAENKVKLLESEAEADRKGRANLLLGVLVLFTAVTGVSVYRQQRLRVRQKEQEFQLKEAIAQIETQQQLQEQRLSISRDLHDNIGAQLTFIISSVDAVKMGFNLQNPALDRKLDTISDFTQSTIIELRDTIWAMNKGEVSFEELRSRIYNFIGKAKTANEDLAFRFTIADSLKEVNLTSVEAINIYRTLQEAVNNAMKHSGASRISITIGADGATAKVTLRDNGKGFDASQVEQGNGLRNMKKRMGEIGGTYTCHSNENGTEVHLSIPLSKMENTSTT